MQGSVVWSGTAVRDAGIDGYRHVCVVQRSGTENHQGHATPVSDSPGLSVAGSYGVKSDAESCFSVDLQWFSFRRDDLYRNDGNLFQLH